MKKSLIAHSLCAGMLVLTVACAFGCRNSVNEIGNADKQASVNIIRDARVTTDSSLKSTVDVTAINTATTENGFLIIQVMLTSSSNYPQNIFYQVDWFDEMSMRVTTASGGWVEQQLMPRESITIKMTAPTPRAKDFAIKLMKKP